MELTTYDGTPLAALRQGEGLGLASTECASLWEALPSCGGGMGSELRGEDWGGWEEGRGGSLIGV